MDTKFRKKLDSYFIAFCRRTFAWSPAYRLATKKAEVKSNGSLKWRCAHCKALVGKGEKHRDHIDPVIPVETGWNGSWDFYRDRMFVEDGQIQILCKACHKVKTQAENVIRRNRRKRAS